MGLTSYTTIRFVKTKQTGTKEVGADCSRDFINRFAKNVKKNYNDLPNCVGQPKFNSTYNKHTIYTVVHFSRIPTF